MILRKWFKINAQIVFILTLPICTVAFGAGPITEALGGAMRSGIEREAVLGNPAALGVLDQSFLRGYYGKSRLLDTGAGGKNIALGIYDGQNTNAHAGVEYVKESRAVSHRGVLGYRDRGELRIGAGRQIWGSVLGGATLRRVTVRDGGPEESFFDVDVGALFPLSSDMRVGLLAQNLAKSQRAAPATLGFGARYDLGSGIILRGDLGKLSSGDRKGEKFWAGGLEVTAFGDLLLRTGLYHDAYSDDRGQSFGAGWVGPRSIFDYSYVRVKNAPNERRHTLGLTVFI